MEQENDSNGVQIFANQQKIRKNLLEKGNFKKYLNGFENPALFYTVFPNVKHAGISDSCKKLSLSTFYSIIWSLESY